MRKRVSDRLWSSNIFAPFSIGAISVFLFPCLAVQIYKWPAEYSSILTERSLLSVLRTTTHCRLARRQQRGQTDDDDRLPVCLSVCLPASILETALEVPLDVPNQKYGMVSFLPSVTPSSNPLEWNECNTDCPNRGLAGFWRDFASTCGFFCYSSKMVTTRWRMISTWPKLGGSKLNP